MRTRLLALIVVVLSSYSAIAQDSGTVWTATSAERERIARVESGMAPVEVAGQAKTTMSLAQWMELFKIPGLSVAVFDHGKLIWAKAYGVKDTDSRQPVTLDTLFQAGSISKPVTALAVLHYVEKGKFDLDHNINDYLTSWKLPASDITKGNPTTLRQILSHSAGLTVHGFPGYAVGETIPTVPQVLDGAKPANTAAVRVDTEPGKFLYSGGGYTIAQLALSDTLKQPFPQIMRETVIAPLGLKNSTYQQPLPAELAKRTATGYRPSGKMVEGRWHIYPEMAAAGLWTTAPDLARVGIEVAKSKAGESNRVLSKQMTEKMLTVQAEPVGLGFFLGPGTNQFGHNGSDEGFQADLTAFSDTQSGIAIMGNSDNFFMVAERIVDSAAREYGWKNYKREPDSAFFNLSFILQKQGVKPMLDSYHQMKSASPDKMDAGTLNGIGYRVLFAGDTQNAIAIFEQNVREYPEDANVYDSLGEAYMNAGRRDEAIANYKKSLALNPKNDNAVKMLEKLGVDGK